MDDNTLVNYVRNSDDFEYICTISQDQNVCIQAVKEKKTKKLYVKKSFKLTDNDSIYYFYNEVKLLKNAKIEGFPFLKFFGFNPHENGESFLLTEYFDNGSLQNQIDDKFKDAHDDLDTIKMIIFYGIAFGLNYLHKRKTPIVHRDIKPDNIFIDKNFKPYIGDFGFARLIFEGIKMTGNIGTLFYMAPEILDTEETDPDTSIDVYSYSITVLQTLTNSLSFNINDEIVSVYDIEDEEQIKELIKNGKRFVEIESVPDDFKEFITECWDKNPSKRWPMSQIMESMKDHKIFLKNCDSEKFDNYVRELDEALINHQHKEEAEEEEEEEFIEEEETQEFNF